MEFTPFTLDEANEICEDFVDLNDSEFVTMASPTIYLVEDVVVCPFNDKDKQQFIDNYLADKNGARALEFYTGEDYDVILFIFDVDNEADLLHMSIRTYAIEKGVGYDFPVHS